MTNITAEASELFNTAFHKNMSLEAFEYKHLANPELLEVPVTYQRDKGGALISMQWYMGATFRCMGKDVAGAQTSDTASLESARGFPYLRVFIDGNKALKKQGVRIRFETPNHNSLPVVTKMGDQLLGRFHAAILDVCALREKPSGIRGLIAGAPLDKMRKRSERFTAGRSLSHRISRTCPFTEDDYAKMNGRADKIFQKRSEAFYRWRVDDFEKAFAASKHFEIHTLRDAAGELAAFAIVQPLGCGESKIVDWQACDADEQERRDLMQALIVEIVRQADAPSVGAHASEKLARLIVPFVNAEGGEGALFEGLGFALEETDAFCVRLYDGDGNGAGDCRDGSGSGDGAGDCRDGSGSGDSSGDGSADAESSKSPESEELDAALQAALSMANWELREVDLDYYLNVYA